MATKQMNEKRKKANRKLKIGLKEPSKAYQAPETSSQLVNRCNVAEIEELIIEK